MRIGSLAHPFTRYCTLRSHPNTAPPLRVERRGQQQRERAAPRGALLHGEIRGVGAVVR
jgi:hypothetical protein